LTHVFTPPAIARCHSNSIAVSDWALLCHSGTGVHASPPQSGTEKTARFMNRTGSERSAIESALPDSRSANSEESSQNLGQSIYG
jgi:hypothetical protein